MDQIKEILETRLKRTLEKASHYFGINVETCSDGEPIEETAFIRNYSYLLGICSGLQEALKVLEDLDCERENQGIGNKEHLYAVIYLEDSYTLKYAEFTESNIFDAIDKSFSIVYEDSGNLEEYMDELRSRRSDYEDKGDIDGYTMWAEDTISSINIYSQFCVLIDKSEHKPILGGCDPIFLK